jgi:predicted DNA-binding transcriptional regulator YafY
MGSKTPGQPAHAAPKEGDAVGSSHSVLLSKRATSLQRIADALQVSPATLYQPQNAIEAASRPVEQTEGNGGFDRECYALIQAFMRISDPEERLRILGLVQASANRN